ncbi:MAG TPA: 23S rRNA (uracil(1939)-C(5))-methyltransferase RlmD [Chitinophagaceae bacterium]|nr:23S rRNA (uracil(1939)-C(5))-methyltransferase RlmD [Chitinophagaceae bacterium]
MKNRKKTVILEKITVEDYAAEGKSLARVDGKVIFIENAVPGDVVDVRLLKNKKDWAEAVPVNFQAFSPNRVTPFCTHFGVCGGCQWQMLPYEQQLVFKQKQVADNLQRIGKIPLPAIMPIIGCNETTGYRNKMEYTFSNKRFIPAEEFRRMLQEENGQQPLHQGFAGFHAKGVFDKVVEIDICHLQNEPTNQIRKAIAAFALQNNVQFYDARLHTGWLRNVLIRMSTTGELMVNIVLGYEDEDLRNKLLEEILRQFTGITTLLYTINTKKNDSYFDLEPQVYFGKGYILDKLEDFIFKISPKSFFQTNTRQAEKLYQVARDFAGLTGEQVLYDLYCGTGSIGIFASRGTKKVVGVDVVAEAIADAGENAALNNLLQAHFFAGDVIDICDDAFFAQNGKPDVVITDPPRAGMHEKLVTKLLDIAAPVVVYVSCNPATQARDLALLGEKYSVEKIQPVDMFPHTHHIENVVQLKIKS